MTEVYVSSEQFAQLRARVVGQLRDTAITCIDKAGIAIPDEASSIIESTLLLDLEDRLVELLGEHFGVWSLPGVCNQQDLDTALVKEELEPGVFKTLTLAA